MPIYKGSQKLGKIYIGGAVKKIYKGSVLVYEKYATDINWKTDGTYTGVDVYNGQYTLTLHVRSASSDYTLAEVHGAGTYSGTITRGRQPRVNYWNMYCVLYYIDGTSETVWQETSCPEGTATFNVNFVAKKPFNRVLWSLNYNPADSVYCNGWLGPVGNWTLV